MPHPAADGGPGHAEGSTGAAQGLPSRGYSGLTLLAASALLLGCGTALGTFAVPSANQPSACLHAVASAASTPLARPALGSAAAALVQEGGSNDSHTASPTRTPSAAAVALQPPRSSGAPVRYCADPSQWGWARNGLQPTDQTHGPLDLVQPGCGAEGYAHLLPAGVQQCLRARHIMIVGDSTSRHCYTNLVAFLRNGTWRVLEPPNELLPHSQGLAAQRNGEILDVAPDDGHVAPPFALSPKDTRLEARYWVDPLTGARLSFFFLRSPSSAVRWHSPADTGAQPCHDRLYAAARQRLAVELQRGAAPGPVAGVLEGVIEGAFPSQVDDGNGTWTEAYPPWRGQTACPPAACAWPTCKLPAHQDNAYGALAQLAAELQPDDVVMSLGKWGRVSGSDGLVRATLALAEAMRYAASATRPDGLPPRMWWRGTFPGRLFTHTEHSLFNYSDALLEDAWRARGADWRVIPGGSLMASMLHWTRQRSMGRQAPRAGGASPAPWPTYAYAGRASDALVDMPLWTARRGAQGPSAGPPDAGNRAGAVRLAAAELPEPDVDVEAMWARYLDPAGRVDKVHLAPWVNRPVNQLILAHLCSQEVMSDHLARVRMWPNTNTTATAPRALRRQ